MKLSNGSKDFSSHHPFSSITEYFPFDEQTCVMKFGKFSNYHHDTVAWNIFVGCWHRKCWQKFSSPKIYLCDMLFTLEGRKTVTSYLFSSFSFFLRRIMDVWWVIYSFFCWVFYRIVIEFIYIVCYVYIVQFSGKLLVYSCWIQIEFEKFP